MRKHSVRKWIHAACDFLPLLVIPIFALAVRSDNNFEHISVQVEENVVVDFNQKVQNGNFVDASYWYNVQGALSSFTVSNNTINFYPTAQNGAFAQRSIPFVDGHQYLFSVDCLEINNNLSLLCYDDGNNRFACSSKGINAGTTGKVQHITNVTANSNSNIRFTFACNSSSNFQVNKLTNVMVFDLTQMGLEGITLADFNNLFQDSYYETVYSTNVILPNQIVTYNDTDVGSQMVYTLYNTCDKYFNFNQVGVFEDLYNWFEANILGGTAPMSFFIVWNVILFEFVMDLIFLTYMVFMFVIDFAECMIDRFFEKSYRGGR